MNMATEIEAKKFDSTSVNWNGLLDLLECPVCKDYMVENIKQCVQGHSICHNCYDLVQVCPVCRAPRAKWTTVSSQVLPNFIYIPCRYREKGCTVKRLGCSIREHEKFCEHSIKKCPLHITLRCEWKGRFCNMLKHCMKDHPKNLLNENHRMVFSEFACFRNARKYRAIFVMIYDSDRLFRLSAIYCKSADIIRWNCSYLGETTEAGTYSYRLTFISYANQESLVCTHRCSPFLNNKLVFNTKFCIENPFDELLRRCSEKGELVFFIHFAENRAYQNLC